MRKENCVRGKATRHNRAKGCMRRDRCKPIAEILLQPSRKQKNSPRELVKNPALEERWSDDRAHADDEMQLAVATVNSAIEAAVSRMRDGYEDDGEKELCTPFQLMSYAIDGTDVIPAIEEALHRQLGIVQNAVEGTSFAETHFARKWGSVLSEESWSDVEFVDSELESSQEEDWFVLDGDDDDDCG